MYNNPEENINQGVRLVFISRYLERIGDHITNICEKIIYAKNGEMIENQTMHIDGKVYRFATDGRIY